jgi:hypothetical protein
MAAQFLHPADQGFASSTNGVQQVKRVAVAGMTAVNHVPAPARVLTSFGQVVVPPTEAVPSRLLRWTAPVSLHVAGSQASEVGQLAAYQISQVLAHTGMTLVGNGTAGAGQIIVLIVDNLNPNSLDGEADLLGTFWGDANNPAAARTRFVSEVMLPMVVDLRSLIRWVTRPNGHLERALVLIEGGSYNVEFNRRFRRELTRSVGIQGYTLSEDHSLFNLNSLALDLTALDMRILQTIYDPRLMPGMDRDSSLRIAKRILAV